VTASTLSDRIKRFARQGIVAGYHARLSPEALGLDLLAFMLVACSHRAQPATLGPAYKRDAGSPEVVTYREAARIRN
jgi:DNA-binding Lrp family transcriptional regulator